MGTILAWYVSNMNVKAKFQADVLGEDAKLLT